MSNKNLNKLLNIIEENTKYSKYTDKLIKLAFKLAKNNMVDSDFKEKLFHIIEAKAKSDYMADTYRLETGYNFILFKMHAKGIGTKKSPQVAFNCLIEMAKHQSFERHVK